MSSTMSDTYAMSMHHDKNNNYSTRGQVDRLGAENRSDIRNYGLYNADKTSAYGTDNLVTGLKSTKEIELQAAVNVAAGIQASSAGFAATQLQGATNTAAVIDVSRTGFAAGQLQSCHDTGKIIHDATVNASAVALQNTLNAKDGIINATLNAAAVDVQNEKLASAAALLAVQNQSALLAAIAECCCETKMMFGEQKALTIKENSETRTLILANETISLRDKLACKDQELLFERLKNASAR
jgi:hypothetical protein